MPKMKTHKGVQNRFHITGSGKLMRTKGGKSHLRLKKPKRVKRLYSDTVPVNPSDRVRIKRLLPYGLK
jgi:large subunit ribosomal protein L35